MNTFPANGARSLKLHLGCGKSKLPGHIGIDISRQAGVDIICDLQRVPWPFKDSCADECVLVNLLEHLPNTVQVMEELWRVSKPMGLVCILVPYYNSPGAFQDPTHVRFFTERTFDYFSEDGTTDLSHYNYYSRARFEIVRLELCQRRVLKYLPWRIQVLLAHHLATAHALDVVLRTIKRGKDPAARS